MFCHLNYHFDKKPLREWYYKNQHLAKHHKNQYSEVKHWFKLFEYDETVKKIIDELGISEFNVSPRFSFQEKNTRLPLHIDIDRIVGINLNLMDEPAIIHITGKPYSYEAALIDVGTKIHSVESTSTDRLILKFAIRAPWDEIYRTLLNRNLICDTLYDYQSILLEKYKKWVKI